MRRLLIVAAAIAGVMVVLGVARYLVRPRALGLMERMMERVMPRMMDACFGQMSQEQRTFMLTHCRGMLDRVDEKYRVMRSAGPAEVA